MSAATAKIECNLERKLSANLRIIKGKIEENPILERNRNRKLRGFTEEKLSNLNKLSYET